MQIIIPMSGFGERFKEAGYNIPKPLIKVDGKPMISHVIDMFPSDSEFIFICNEDHLNVQQYGMKKVLRLFCPSGKIVGIKAHKRSIHAVLEAKECIDYRKPSVVNYYCDFTCYWDWDDFQKVCSRVLICVGCDT